MARMPTNSVILRIILIIFTIFTLVSGRAEIQSLYITSDIKYRFATTLVSSTVWNQESTSQEATFQVTIPNRAFITKFILEIDGSIYPGIIKETKDAREHYVSAQNRGESAAIVSQRPRETNRFDVDVNVAPQTRVTFNLTYQELLQRKQGRYEHVIYIDPGQLVENMSIRVSIQEVREISYIKVPRLLNSIPGKRNLYLYANKAGKTDTLQTRLHDIFCDREGLPFYKQPTNTTTIQCVSEDDSNIIDRPTPTTALILLHPSTEDQLESSSQGLAGQFIVQYDVNRTQDVGEILVVNGYFVHFFAPAGFEAFPKDVLFVLDRSGSMYGRKFVQMKEAMTAILRDLNEDDRMNIVTFSGSVSRWKNTMMAATKLNVQKAKMYINNVNAGGGTNINSALLKGLSLLKRIEVSNNRSQILVFLTDGLPSIGVSDQNRLLANIQRENDMRISIFSLAFGNDADFNLVKKIAFQNRGFGRKIYEDSDAALQIEDFYQEVAKSLLKDIQFKYIGGEDQEVVTATTKRTFDNYFEGSELTIAGQLRLPEEKDISVEVSGVGVEGNIIMRLDRKIDLHISEDGVNLTQVADFDEIIEKMWAYLTVKQTLEKAQASTDLQTKKMLRQKALQLSLEYQFVTQLTSMVVTKPLEVKSENATIEVEELTEEDDTKSRDGIACGTGAGLGRVKGTHPHIRRSKHRRKSKGRIGGGRSHGLIGHSNGKARKNRKSNSRRRRPTLTRKRKKWRQKFRKNRPNPNFVHSSPTLTFASYYGSHMVLQKAPAKNYVWGYASPDGSNITVTLSGRAAVVTVVKGGIWKVQLPAESEKGPFTLTAMSSVNNLVSRLDDVLFGDVWVCSGQSNMQFSMSQVINASQELAEVTKYPEIRVFTVDLKSSATPLTDLRSVEEPWSVPSKDTIGHSDWKYFSAVCWLYGKYLYQHLNYPIGLIDTDWGGTVVEAWSSPDALRMCGSKTNLNTVGAKDPSPNTPSVLWNSMIHPLLNLTIYGAIWYQGESNAAGPTKDKYNCTFPAMIDDWRQKFNEGTDGQTSGVFPFGFVQLAGWRDDPSITTGFPDIRWHQTADFGYVPNARMENVFMAVAMDLPDFKSPYGSIHPRYKQDVAARLTLAGLTVAYNRSVGQYQGPFPSAFFIDIGYFTLGIGYGVTSEVQVISNDGFEVCCSHNNQSACDPADSMWMAAPIISHNSHVVTMSYKGACSNKYIVGVRYAWRESPCQFKQCAVYSVENNLPAPPYISIGLIGGDPRVSGLY